jgi:U3 small nucleolar RNA-associated protein 6
MELGFIESLRRRWDVLGINTGDKGKERAHDAEGFDEIIQEQADNNEDAEGAASRQDIMQGAIVKSVITSAVQGAVVSLM